MSEAVRNAIADAASTVADIRAKPYYVQGTNPGHAYVRTDRIQYPNKFGGVHTWNLVVILPQAQAAAEKFFDAHVPQLVAALQPVMKVTEAVPQLLNIPDVGNLPCVFITGLCEEE